VRNDHRRGEVPEGEEPDVRIVAIEPEKGHHLSGLKNFQESKKPLILDESLIDKTVRVPDAPAYDTAIRLAREESLLVGPSTGAIVWAALQENLPADAVAVCISPTTPSSIASHYSPVWPIPASRPWR